MKRIMTLGLALTAATPALAHHPLGGLPMETFMQGMMSGVGHPVLGFDHLFFVAIMGVAAAFTTQRLVAPLAYVAAMLVGCALMAAGVALPATEIVIVASLLAVGGLVAAGRTLTLAPMLALFAVFGLFHGSAFGGSIAGQEGGVGGAVFAGYLIGLAAIQYAVALAAGYATRGLLRATEATAVNARLAGAMVMGVGLFLGLEIIEGPIVAVLAG